MARLSITQADTLFKAYLDRRSAKEKDTFKAIATRSGVAYTTVVFLLAKHETVDEMIAYIVNYLNNDTK